MEQFALLQPLIPADTAQQPPLSLQVPPPLGAQPDAQNYSVRPNFFWGAIASMIEGCGRRRLNCMKLDCRPYYLRTYITDAAVNHPEAMSPTYIAASVQFCLDNQRTNGNEKEAAAIVQCCAAFVPLDDCPDISTTRRFMANRMRATHAALVEIVGQNQAEWFVAGGDLPAATVPTTEEIHNIITVLAQAEGNRALAVRMLTSGILAYCKQGAVTNNVQNKVTNAIRDEMGFNISLDANVIRLVCEMCSSWFDPIKAAACFVAWEECVGASCSTLRLLIQPLNWSGMTNFTKIAIAKSRFPTFNWEGLASFIPQDFDNYREAVNLVTGNPHFWYNRDLGFAKSTSYPALAYAACVLLNDCGEDVTLRGYRGINRNIAQAPVIDTMIATFRTTIAQLPK